MEFGTPYEAKTGKPVDMAAFSEWTAFCGIAKPDDFFKACKKCLNQELETRSYPDHYAFTVKDLKELKEKAEKQKSRLITTEKDWMRIKNMDTVDLKNLYILPMKVKILQEKEVWNQIFQSLQSFRQSNGI
jgi:tetraacyldisaccharide 4'-kinase